MTRVYASADLDQLLRLAAGERVEFEVNEAESEDEEHEYEAMLQAAERSHVVVTAEVSVAGVGIELKDVDSFHLDTDGSGDLSWFARQELVHVIEILNADEG